MTYMGAFQYTSRYDRSLWKFKHYTSYSNTPINLINNENVNIKYCAHDAILK